MNSTSRITILHLSPRVVGSAILVLALTGETYLMSLRNEAAASTTITSQSHEMTLPGEQTSSPPLPTTQPLRDNDHSLVQSTGPAADSAPQNEKTTASTDAPVAGGPTAPAASDIPARPLDRATVLTALGSLELQSVVGSHQTCIINDVICKEGQQVDGFTVETIGSNSVTVSMGIYRFQLSPRR